MYPSDLSPQNILDYFQVLFRNSGEAFWLSRDVSENLQEMRLSFERLEWLWLFGYLWQCLWYEMDGDREFLRVSRGCWRVSGCLRAMSGSMLPLISFNFISITNEIQTQISICHRVTLILTYWHIGKHWKRFQSWVISAYFFNSSMWSNCIW